MSVIADNRIVRYAYYRLSATKLYVYMKTGDLSVTHMTCIYNDKQNKWTKTSMFGVFL